MAKRKAPTSRTWEEKKNIIGRFLELRAQGVPCEEAATQVGTSTANIYSWRARLKKEPVGSELVSAATVKKARKLTTPYMKLDSTNLPQEPTFTLTKRQLMDLINDLLSMRTATTGAV